MSNNVANKSLGNERAERAVLAAWLGGIENLGEPPKPDLFWNPANKEIAQAVAGIWREGEGIEIIRVQERIDQMRNPVCTPVHLSEVTYADLDPGNYKAHLQILRENRGRQRVAELAESLSSQALAGTSVTEVLGSAAKHIEGIAADISAQSKEAEISTAGELRQLTIPEDNPAELFKHRFLCRRSALLFISNTGQGKSTLIYQAAYFWAAGREAFGLRPARPMRVLVIQAENDPQDLAEILQGAEVGLNKAGLSQEEIAIADRQVMFVSENGTTGESFIRHVRLILQKMADTNQGIDLLVVDPVLSYLGGDPLKAQDVTQWLRGGIQVLADAFDLGVILICHTAKPARQNARQSAVDDWYSALGSVEWINYARASLLLKPVAPGYFELRGGKRSPRLRWKDSDGNPSFVQRLAHANDGGIYWRVPSDEEFEMAASNNGSRKREPSIEEFATLFLTTYEGPNGDASTLSAAELKLEFTRKGWAKDSYVAIRDRAESLGIIKLIERGRPNEKRYAISAIADRINQERANRIKEEHKRRKALKQTNLRGLEDDS